MKVKTAGFLMLALGALLIADALAGGCAGPAPEAPPVSPPLPAAIIKDVTVQGAHGLIESSRDNPGFVILDVRTPEEYTSGHIEGAVNLDFSSTTFREEVSRLDRNRKYLVYCHTGRRSAGAVSVMKELGFTEVYNMSGGISDWQAAGFPVVK